MNKRFVKITSSLAKRERDCRMLNLGVILLFLLLSLTACASGPQSVAPIVTETQTVQIPQALTNPTEPAICRLATNGDLVDCIKAYDNQLNSCNGDKASIVEFQKESK